MSSPPNRSQMGGKPGTTAAEKSLNQSGFGGWVDEKIEVPREAGPLLLAQRGQRMRPPKISSTTFDNTSSSDWLISEYQSRTKPRSRSVQQ
jgi:hypothetical protein